MTTTLMSAPVNLDSIITPAPQKNFVITPYMQEVINGSMLGDATIYHHKAETGDGYGFTLTTACEQYSDYLLKQLPGMRQTLTSRALCPDNIYYQVFKGCKALFQPMREEWYPSQANGTSYKEVPFGLELTPTTVLHWYLGDGHKNKEGHFIKLHTEGFKAKDVELLALKLSDAVGIPVKTYQVNKASNNPYVSYKQVYISGKANVAKFLEYIGECPFAQYRHKWIDGLSAKEAKYTPDALVTTGSAQVKATTMRKLVNTSIDNKTGRKAFKLYNVKSI